ncbi:MAG: hypothetical protein RBU21_12475 [FCB group bacterium]|jgi:hypothetical protein|nr:hypothetical protein [FCB group bacterium]
MAVVTPQTFFRFAADHHELLVELYQHRDGITEATLLQLVRRFAGEGTPSASYMVDRLRDLGFIDYAPHATAQYEMARPFAELMSGLLREYRLTSVEVIRAYFTAMDGMATEIGQAIADKNAELMVRALKDTAEHVERMRHDSRRNRDEVVSTAMRVKSNKDRMPPMRRYEIINRLWTRYLVPLRDMIDSQKAMDASLDRMERVLEEAEVCFQMDGAVAPVIGMGRARVRRLRRDVVLDFRESIREIAPLYEELRRENALARGASHALETMSKQGLTRMALPRQLGICNWQQQGLFSDSALEAYLLTLQGYVPGRPQPIPEGMTETAREHVRMNEFDSRVAAALPIPDALTWLAESYPEAPLSTVLRLYGRMHSGRYGSVGFGEQEEEYALWDVTLEAHPMNLNRQDAKGTKGSGNEMGLGNA